MPFTSDQVECATCDLCGRGDGPVVWEGLGLQARSCEDCGVIYLSRRPDDNARKALYGEAYYGSYAAHREARLRNLRGTVLPLIPEGGGRRAVDIGCGTGMILAELAAKGWKVTGVEPSEVAAKAAARAVPSAEIVVSDGETAALPPESADLVTVIDVLAHVGSPAALLRKCAEVLRPGGLLVLRTPARGIAHFRAANLLSCVFKDSSWFIHAPYQCHHFSLRGMEKALRAAGLAPQNIAPCDDARLPAGNLRSEVFRAVEGCLRRHCRRREHCGDNWLAVAEKDA